MEQDERANTHYKDTVFRLLFSDKARLLSLYNALSEKRSDNIDDLTVVTLKDAIYMEVKNDIAFLVGTDIHMYEHQSTINPNMPLRFLEYIASEYPLSLRSAYEFANANVAAAHRQEEHLFAKAREAAHTSLCGVLQRNRKYP